MKSKKFKKVLKAGVKKLFEGGFYEEIAPGKSFKEIWKEADDLEHDFWDHFCHYRAGYKPKVGTFLPPR